ncbi:DUF6484 domain-containing protein [Ralstonia pseudosolanacearum]|uniref:DUF6484 domain-containing protein n=1 Tax=Ralstonia pseudosolanacearum TaxID=1310165 RepID=UPI003D07FE67
MKPESKADAAQAAEPQSMSTEALLDQVIARTAPPLRAEGIAVGRLDAVAVDGTPRIAIDMWGLAGLQARSVVPVDAEHLGQVVALGFENADPRRPIILGFMIAPQPPAQPEARVDGQRLVLTAERDIELRCGEAAIVLSADGTVQIRGTYIISYATASQRILGGSVNLN